MTDGLTETQRAFLQSQYNREVFEDMSAADINRLSMAEYAARTGRIVRTTPDTADFEPPGQPRQEPAQIAPERPADVPVGVDLNAMSMAEYAAVRGQLGMGRGREYGRGALDGGSTADWIAAAQSKAGRSGWQGANVTEAPRIQRAYVQQDEPPVYRSATERFSTPGNYFGS